MQKKADASPRMASAPDPGQLDVEVDQPAGRELARVLDPVGLRDPLPVAAHAANVGEALERHALRAWCQRPGARCRAGPAAGVERGRRYQFV